LDRAAAAVPLVLVVVTISGLASTYTGKNYSEELLDRWKMLNRFSEK
jgi:hypothetical protein